MGKYVYVVQIDEKGRITIPAEIRKRLNLERGKLIIYQIGDEIVIKKVFVDENEISRWRKEIEKIIPEVKERVEKIKDKWMSEEYVRTKLGL